MRKTSITFMVAALLLATSCSLYERERIDLSGNWESSLGDCTLPGTTDENRLGPGAKDTIDLAMLTRAYPYEGVVEYRRTITIPEGLESKRLSLVMERTKPSVLAIDGEEVGRYGHILSSHVYDLPALEAGEHELVITIDNSSTSVPAEIQSSHAWTNNTQTNWNGILGDFFIEAKDSIYISDVRINTDRTSAHITAIVHTDVEEAADILFKSGKTRKWIRAMLFEGDNKIEATLDFGDKAKPWSEFHPKLYPLEVRVKSGRSRDMVATTFGLRDFTTDGTQFSINGKKTFLRGKHDACVFPLCGHVPTDVETWRKTFSKAKEYGINHYRFHSYTPTEAAFQAADELGIYLQCELPFWGTVDPEKPELCEFLKNEGERIIREFGNHPSFVMMSLGNELGGDIPTMRSWVEAFRQIDSTKLFCFGSNDFIGWMGPQEGEDYYVAAKNKGSQLYETHLRGSQCICDGIELGIINGTRPNTNFDYSGAMDSNVPCIGHEIGQYQIYPDYSEIEKYTGILEPRNLMAFRDRMLAQFGKDRSAEFQNATGQWSMLCYKAEMEAALRTPGFGGFELLDLQDFPGQGTALVGILDAFMDEKHIDGIERWKESCSPVVLLARFEDYSLSVGDTLKAVIQVANYSEEDWNRKIFWSFGGSKGTFKVSALQGCLTDAGEISVAVKEAGILDLQLKTGKTTNTYNIFAFDANAEEIDPRIRTDLTSGIGGLFICEFWNYGMFKGISEWLGAAVSPGTMCVLPSEEFSRYFPCTGHTDWNWWSIMKNARPAILDGKDDCIPVVELIDNLERAHRLALVYRKGDELVSTVDLQAIEGTPEGDAFRAALNRLAAEL